MAAENLDIKTMDDDKKARLFPFFKDEDENLRVIIVHENEGVTYGFIQRIMPCESGLEEVYIPSF
jgi:hypothetical protein